MYIHVSVYIKVFTSILNVTYYHVYHFSLSSVQSLSCVWLCMDCSTPGFPVHHHLPELAQTHVHRVSDTIQPISSSVVPFSSCLQSFPASGSFPITQLFSSGEGNGTPLQYSCLEKFHGRRSLVGCSPWGRRELDMTKWLHFHFPLSCIGEGNGNPLQWSCLENPRDGGAW